MAIELADSRQSLSLDFTAGSDRTVLSIKAPDAEAGSAWVLSDLRLSAEL